MAGRDAFGREVGEEDPAATAAERGPTGATLPRWLMPMIAFDLLVVVVVLAVFVF